MELQLAGKVELRDAQNDVKSFRTKKVALLLAILVEQAGSYQQRTALAELIWPEYEQRKSRDSLRNALAELRKLLPGNVIECRGEEISLKPGVIVCKDFHLVSLSDYRGEFMPGHESEWTLDHRLRLRTEAVELAMSEAIQLVNASDFTAALRYAEMASQFDPFDESAARLRVQILSQLSKGAQAIQVSDIHRSRMIRSLGVVSDLHVSQISSENSLANTALWLLDRHHEEAMEFLISTRDFWNMGDVEEGISIHERVLAATPTGSRHRNLVYAQWQYLLWIAGRVHEHLEDVRSQTRTALAEHDADLLARVGGAAVFGLLSAGAHKESLQLAREIRDFAKHYQTPLIVARQDIILSIIELHAGTVSRSDQILKQTQFTFLEHGTAHDIANWRNQISRVHANEGRLDLAMENCQAARRYCLSCGGVRFANWCRMSEVHVLELAGENLRARQVLEEIRSSGEAGTGHSMLASIDDQLARINLSLNEVNDAAEAMARASLYRRRMGTSQSPYERSMIRPIKDRIASRLSPREIQAAYYRAKISGLAN